MDGKYCFRSGLGVIAATTLALLLCSSAHAQADKADARSAGATPSGQQPRPGKISEEDLRKLRQLEVKSGVRTKAAEGPEVQTLKGPPLNDREKVIHVLNRMSFGPRPGEVDKVLAGGGYEKWVEQQLKPDAIDDSALDDELAQRYPWLKLNLQEMKAKYPIAYQQEYHPELRIGLRNAVLHRALLDFATDKLVPGSDAQAHIKRDKRLETAAVGAEDTGTFLD